MKFLAAFIVPAIALATDISSDLPKEQRILAETDSGDCGDSAVVVVAVSGALAALSTPQCIITKLLSLILSIVFTKKRHKFRLASDLFSNEKMTKAQVKIDVLVIFQFELCHESLLSLHRRVCAGHGVVQFGRGCDQLQETLRSQLHLRSRDEPMRVS
ncbi:hypothetical protein Ae201684P_003382 [Aphanomyces euteiches]|nr:hypothetical protein Ae201684P_003382 [Aphanomyces euteiches]